MQIRDRKQSVSSVVGRGFHKALEHYYTTKNWNIAVGKGLEIISSIPDKSIDFGKTGSRETILKQYNQAILFYQAEEMRILRDPTTEILGAEVNYTTDVGWEGEALPLPVKAISDLVVKTSDGQVIIIDHKTCKSFSDKDSAKGDYYMQAAFNYMTVKARFNLTPTKMVFSEVKLSKNKDNTSQVDYYEINYTEHPEIFMYFNKMYAGFLINVSNPDYQYLPNFGDTWTGQDAWEDFIKGVIDFSTFKPVTHKSIMKTVTPDVQYTPSALTGVEAKNLTAEERIEYKLREFGIPVEMKETHVGANVTLYTCVPAAGVSTKKIVAQAPDIQLALAAKSVRIQAPIPGTHLVGIEVSNEHQKTIEWNEKLLVENTLLLPVGVDVNGKQHSVDLARAPHLMIAGSTGAGKSVTMHSFIHTLTMQNSPDSLQLILIDPKRTEFIQFSNQPHLINKIITETDEAAYALEWALEEMERRYTLLAQKRVRDIDEYIKAGFNMAKIVIVIDELSDLMLTNEKRVVVTQEGISSSKANEMRAQRRDGKLPPGVREEETKEISISKDIENSIVRLAQKARAAGIHLIVATQRPSVDVITGIMKANFVTRIAFMTASATDSQVILDEPGAENLIGSGDCLLKDPKNKGLIRLQSYFVQI